MELGPLILWLLFGFVSATYLFFKSKYSHWKDRGVNYVEPSFPLGNLARNHHLKDIFGKLYKQKDNSQVVGGYIIWKPILIPTSLNLIQNILVKDFNNFHDRGMYVNEKDDPLSAHMFSLDGEKWKSIRSKLSPTFTSGKMKFMFSTVVDVATRFQNAMTDLVEGDSELEMRDLLGRFTTDVIGSCAFGIECNSLKDPNAIFRHYGKKFFDKPHLNTVAQMVTMFYPELSRKFGIRFLAKDVGDFFSNSVRDTIAYREKHNIRRNDFMDLLIEMKNETSLEGEGSRKMPTLTSGEIAAQAFLFFIAGFETSSTTMTFALYELSKNQDIQEKARQEIQDVIARHEGRLTYEATQEMKYVDQIINETLRKFPPLAFLNRKAVNDYQIPNSKTTIEKGTVLFIPVYQIHHDPEIYPDPEVFDPERFAPEQVKGRHPMSFLGFGDGPRNCIGLRFGRMQSRIGLIALLQKYRFRPTSKTPAEIEFEPNKVILTPTSGMVLKVERI